MAPREVASVPPRSWSQLVTHSKSLRAEIRSTLSTSFTKMALIDTPTGCRLFALGTPNGQCNQTVLFGDISTESSEVCSLKALYDVEAMKSSPPSQEFSLMCERQRACVVTGIADYFVHPNTKYILATSGDKVIRIFGETITSVSQEGVFPTEDSFVFDAQFCPSDTSLISYVHNKQIHIETSEGLIYSTSSEGDTSNGVACFITQEELDRFAAIWWSPTQKRLLYEHVDETRVKSLQFTCPGKEATSPMKYPVVGTENARSELKIIVLDTPRPRDVGMMIPLSTRFRWMEYVVRAGFLNDGITIWAVIMNRTQTRCALVVIPESEFPGFDDRSSPVKETTVIHEEESSSWINCHNCIVPLDYPGCSSIEFIYASEVHSNCHLFLTGVQIDKNKEVTNSKFVPITAGAFSICKATECAIDSKRQLVYFVANCSSPLEWNVCVASYSQEKAAPVTKQLTPSGVSVKSDRSNHKLTLLPDKGFACWITSLNQPQHCMFYKIIHSESGGLPEAKILTTIALAGSGIPPSVTEDCPQIIQYHSQNSGEVHMAMVIRPPSVDCGKSYPVIHYVYGGPGIQVVRNDYTAWASFQKFTKLGYIVVLVDGRGSSNRGNAFESPIKCQLGNYEVEDQVEGLLEVAKLTHGQLDLERVVIQGWSYGGYMSLLALAKHPEIYRGACAGGAVTDWRLYDTCYTERYMGYPVTAVYDSSSVIKNVEKLPDEPGRLLIIHGLMDENVHFRHTERLIEALIRHAKPYQLQIFPSERHGVRSSDAANHLDASMLYFFQQLIG